MDHVLEGCEDIVPKDNILTGDFVKVKFKAEDFG
jgi:hypothetical protein